MTDESTFTATNGTATVWLDDSGVHSLNGLPSYPIRRPTWCWSIDPTFASVSFLVTDEETPNAFCRFMQRWVLGIRWQRLPVQALERVGA